jgi:hypothetical protein
MMIHTDFFLIPFDGFDRNFHFDLLKKVIIMNLVDSFASLRVVSI